MHHAARGADVCRASLRCTAAPCRRRRATWAALAVVATALTSGAAGVGQVAQIPVPSIATAAVPLPGVLDLPVRAAMPDVMTMDDGRPVTTAAEWSRRREEMKRILAYYAVGQVPPAPGNVSGRDLKQQVVLGGAAVYRLVHLSFGARGNLGCDVAIFIPAEGKGPFPTIIFPSFGATPGAVPLPTMVRPPEQGKGLDALSIPLGDQAARAAAAAAGAPPSGGRPAPATVDPEAGAKAHAEALRRGYAVVTYHYQDTGEDTIGRNTDGSWAFRATRFFPAFPRHDWGLLGAWAWGVSRVVDYLETQAFADTARIVATGHSRLGKAVLVAGAFDERLSLVAPAGSGAGGTGAYRFNGAGRGGREGLDDMLRKYPNWFSPHLYQFKGHVERLPFDQHWFIALAAPRAFLSLEGDEDQNCVPNALEQAWRAARPAFELLKVPGRVGVNFASHRHALTPEDWDALLDFADQQLRGMRVERRFDRFPAVPAEP